MAIVRRDEKGNMRVESDGCDWEKPVPECSTPVLVESHPTDQKPSYDDLFKFWESSLNLFVEGVEFMNKIEIYEAIKADCMKVSGPYQERNKMKRYNNFTFGTRAKQRQPKETCLHKGVFYKNAPIRSTSKPCTGCVGENDFALCKGLPACDNLGIWIVDTEAPNLMD